MKRNAKTRQQILLEMEEIRTRLDAAEERLQEANEILGAEIAKSKCVEGTLVEAQKYAENIVETIHHPLVVLTADLRVKSANRSFYETFKLAPEETKERFMYSVGDRQWDIPRLRELLEEIVPKNTHFNNFEVDHEFPGLGRKRMILNARRIYRESRGTDMILLAIEDITERKQMEESLQASETRYRRLFETAQDGILILNADTGQIVDVNPFLVEMLGYAREEFLGKKLWEIGPFKDIAASQASFEELQNKEYIRYENLPLESKGGQHRQVEFVSNVYPVDSTKVIQCNIRDITARKLAEESLRRAHETLSSLVTALQRRDAEMTLLNRMNDLLQTCETKEEAYRVIALTAAELFVEQRGCLAVLHSSNQVLETVARWGDEALVENVFSLEDCWAMRSGRPHEVMDPRTSLLCSHFVRPPERGYLCLPLTVQGETIGVFYLDAAPTSKGTHQAGQHQLAVTVGEAIKLSLANLKLRKKLHEQATRDPLTGLFNRRYLEDTLPRELHRTLRRNAPLCLAMLDLDYFKRFNDTFGHDAGDLVLRESARLLNANLRKSDIACRYGGEEFVLVLPDSSLVDTNQRLEQVRFLFERLEIRHDGQPLSTLTLSAGIAAAPEHGSTAEELLRAADAALYAAKRGGRNCVLAYQVRD